MRLILCKYDQDHRSFFQVFFLKSYRMVWNLQPYSEDWSYLFTTALHFCKWIFLIRFIYHFEIFFPSIGRLFKIKKSPNTKLFTKINSTGCKIDWTKQFSQKFWILYESKQQMMSNNYKISMKSLFVVKMS